MDLFKKYYNFTNKTLSYNNLGLFIGNYDNIALLSNNETLALFGLTFWDVLPQQEEVLNALYHLFGKKFLDFKEWFFLIRSYQPDFYVMRLEGLSDDYKLSVSELVQKVQYISSIVDKPLVLVLGQDINKDEEFYREFFSNNLDLNKFIVGPINEDNYNILSKYLSKYAYLIAESPVDINLSKQLNILLSDGKFSLDKIFISSTPTALGYGLEYIYSIIERIRIEALKGDKYLSSLQITILDKEFIKSKEFWSGEYSEIYKQATLYELATAITYINAGSSFISFLSPYTLNTLKDLRKKILI